LPASNTCAYIETHHPNGQFQIGLQTEDDRIACESIAGHFCCTAQINVHNSDDRTGKLRYRNAASMM
jgi:hypothetical protein